MHPGEAKGTEGTGGAERDSEDVVSLRSVPPMEIFHETVATSAQPPAPRRGFNLNKPPPQRSH